MNRYISENFVGSCFDFYRARKNVFNEMLLYKLHRKLAVFYCRLESRKYYATAEIKHQEFFPMPGESNERFGVRKATSPLIYKQ